jgi:hypothetical protein
VSCSELPPPAHRQVASRRQETERSTGITPPSDRGGRRSCRKRQWPWPGWRVAWVECSSDVHLPLRNWGMARHADIPHMISGSVCPNSNPHSAMTQTSWRDTASVPQVSLWAASWLARCSQFPLLTPAWLRNLCLSDVTPHASSPCEAW